MTAYTDALRRRRRERAATPATKSPLPPAPFQALLRDELDVVAARMFAANPMPFPTDKEISMHLQLVEPETMPDATPPAAPESAAAEWRPITRAEWRQLVEARCAERNITVAHACREMGILTNFFSPSNSALGIPNATATKLQVWLDGELPTIEPPARSQRQIKASPPTAAPSTITYNIVASPAPARPARRYPAITVEPSAMPLDDLVEYLTRLRDLMPGATVTWATAMSVSTEPTP